MKAKFVITVISILGAFAAAPGLESSNWSYDLGLVFFKTSLRNQPDELSYNPVFKKWEAINNQPTDYSVDRYAALEPYPFNFNGGIEALIRYRKYFMIKIGYTYTNTFGIGGTGNITYTDLSTDVEISESKEMSYSSHQLNYFLGPLLPINDNGAELFMGFSMMSPTFVSFTEQYIRKEAGVTVREYEKTFTGFFGNCRSVIGMQVPVTKRVRVGSELVFAYFNGIELKSGSIKDEGFTFPDYQWHFSFRYHVL